MATETAPITQAAVVGTRGDDVANEEVVLSHTKANVPAQSASVPIRSTNSLTWTIKNNVFYILEQLLCLIDGSKFSPKTPYLLENYAPVRNELYTEDLEVLGKIPDCLNGAFVRTGPNPYFDPTARYHWFDGCGMLHAVRFKGGKASYCNRFVETSRLAQEKAAGYSAGGKFGDYRGFLGLLHVMLDQAKLRWKVLDDSQGLGTANTALAFHAGRLLALHEGDAPYWVKVACNGLVSTIQRFTFNGRLEHSFTAHPKIDPVTGELFAFGYSVERAPYCWLYRCDPNGALVSTVEVPLPAPIMMHDFALTERYVIFMDVPLLFQPDAMLKKGTLPFVYEKTRPARFGVLDRYATDSSGIKWFTTDPCMVFHVANAWETDPSGTRIELYVCAFNDFSLDAFTAVSPDSEPHLTRITLDMTSGEATMLRLSPIPGDFPVVPATLVGRRTRYSYVAAFETSPYGSPLFYGVTKVDLAAPGPQAAVVGVLEHGAGRLGGEAYFVPKEGGTDEDDGYLMTYVFDGAKDCSELVVYDAKTMSSTPVARVLLPQRVPHGFHCTWVTEEQLAAQRKA